MKQERLEQWVLLEHSGELTGWKRWFLHRALKKDPALRHFREELEWVTNPSTHMETGGTPAETMNAILARAAEMQEKPERATPVPTPVFDRHLLWPAAAAALVAVGVAIMLWLSANRQGASTPTIAQSQAETEAVTDLSGWTLFDDDTFDEDIAMLYATLSSSEGDFFEEESMEQVAAELLDLEEESI